MEENDACMVIQRIVGNAKRCERKPSTRGILPIDVRIEAARFPTLIVKPIAANPPYVPMLNTPLA